jgi:anti-sigma factor RsiW
MECNTVRPLLDADSDGELDLVRHLELEEHLRACASCAGLAEAICSRRNALRESLPRFTAPPHLVANIRAALAAEIKPAASLPTPASGASIAWRFWRIAGIAASIGVALLIGYNLGGANARSNALFDDAVSSHIRSLEAGHLTDVASTDQHTVKPWFAGKLDFAPPVFDLAAAGFPLIGGRLEYLDGRPAAALVFQRRKHAINLFVWPSGSSSMSTRQTSRDGYNAVSWSQGSFNFVAVSEIPAAELAQFADEYGRLGR